MLWACNLRIGISSLNTTVTISIMQYVSAIASAYAICTTLVITEFLPYWAIRSWRAISEFLAKIATSMLFEYKSFLTLTLAWYTWNPGATDSCKLYCEPCGLFPYCFISFCRPSCWHTSDTFYLVRRHTSGPWHVRTTHYHHSWHLHVSHALGDSCLGLCHLQSFHL